MGKIDHSAAGAVYINQQASGKERPDIGMILAYLIAGHHTGLPDYYSSDSKGKALNERITEKQHSENALSGHPPEDILNVSLPSSSPCNGKIHRSEDIHLWIRMMYSCLVDADFLDTEKFMNPDDSELREKYRSLPELKKIFDDHMNELGTSASDSVVNRNRQKILAECREKASEKPGFFSLTVPTGGGKTLSSMAFALDHAVRYNKKRIIVAIPYTSIIEQNAEVYKKIFGEENVIEHHSNLDPEKMTQKSKLATENWDAPIIVTTNVRLFESLFASKSSACRKLHNIANSVIILDEVQMIPTDYLKPIIDSMKTLADCFGVSFVLSTATQPALTGKIGSGKNSISGFDKDTVREIMSDVPSLFDAFRRVQIRVFGDVRKRCSWEKIAAQLSQYDQVLCIVNTRKDSQELFSKMPEENTYYLSGLMCAHHRTKVISEIKRRLDDKLPVRVISTQLIEAGVDIDFPVVFRAFSGFDSIAQAAGRCNREGKMEIGTVYVFNSQEPCRSGLLRKSETIGAKLYDLDPEKYSHITPEACNSYFKEYFRDLISFDKKNIGLYLVKNASNYKFQFRKAASEFRLIDDSNQQAVIVKYHPENLIDYDENNSQKQNKETIEELLETIKTKGASTVLMRKLQRYTVNVYPNQLEEMIKKGTVEPLTAADEQIKGLYVQRTDSLYDSVKGLQISVKPGIDDFYV